MVKLSTSFNTSQDELCLFDDAFESNLKLTLSQRQRSGGPRSYKSTPGKYADRFIPRRSTKSPYHNYELSQHSPFQRPVEKRTPARNYDEKLSQVMELKSVEKVLRFGNRSTRKQRPKLRKRTRLNIDRDAIRILDAPNVQKDSNLNHIDWNVKKNTIAICLMLDVFLWNDDATSSESQIVRIRQNHPVSCSVKFSPCGTYLAVGMETAVVKIYDLTKHSNDGNGGPYLMREICTAGGRIAALDWHKDFLAVGSAEGAIQIHDLRIRDSLVSRLFTHKNEISSLRFNNDGQFLASGGRDSIVCVWEKPGSQAVVKKPFAKFVDHSGGVKALEWCPWKYNNLVSGGGAGDEHIRVWNLRTQKCERSLHVGGEVIGIHFSPWRQHFVTVQANPCNNIKLFSFTDFKHLATMEGHDQKIVHSAHRGSQIVTLAECEQMKFWHCFGSPEKINKDAIRMGSFSAGIR